MFTTFIRAQSPSIIVLVKDSDSFARGDGEFIGEVGYECASDRGNV